MSQTITIAKFRDVSEGLQPGQFAIGDREVVSSLDSLDPIYKELLDRPITITLGLIGPDGRVSLTPMWFDYDGDHVLVNTAAHRSKCGWIRNNPELTILVVNPDNPYHWVQIKCTVEREELEEGETGAKVTQQVDKIWRNIRVTNRPMGFVIPALMRSECCLSVVLIE